MPTITGPDTPISFPDGKCTPLVVTAKTVGEAIKAYERAFCATLIPYDGRWPDLPFDPAKCCWFIYSGSRRNSEELLVGLTVFRGNEALKFGVDLGFPLLPGDALSLGALGC